MVQRLNKLCEICQRVTRECTDNYEDITRRPKSWMQSDNPLEGEDHDCTTHINDWLFSIPYRHHDNINMLEQSAARGCHFCTMLKLHLSTKGSLNETLPIFVRHDINPRNRAWNVAIHEFKIEIAVFFHASGFHSYAEGQPPPTAYFTNDNDPPDAVFDMIKYWLSHCRDEHRACQDGGHSRLPSRVIDVIGEGSNGNPHLLESSGACGTYTTLSHSWGQRPNRLPQTKTTNLEKHRKSIPLETLPKTFQDAILVTRRLGVQYLWIDSLCIIQDDKHDWELESERMADIYRKSVCNLAADAASDSNGGLFIERNRMQVSTCVFQRPLYRGSSSDMSWYISPLSGNYTGSISEQHLFGPLTSRGWVLQERLLPSRTLHFLPNQIVWECQEMAATEYKYIQTERKKLDLATTRGEVKDHQHLLPQVFLHGFPNFGANVYGNWYRLIENFCNRQLTYAKDRLPAIWALAQMFQNSNSGHYIAGLWKEDLLRGLLFIRETEMPSSNESLAPSWSWAALEGKIVYPMTADGNLRIRIHNMNEAKILKVDVAEAGRRAMGRTTRAALTVSTYARVAICEPQKQPLRSTPPVHPISRSYPSRRFPSHSFSSCEYWGDNPGSIFENLTSRSPIQQEEVPEFDRYWLFDIDKTEDPSRNTERRREVFSQGHLITFDQRVFAEKYAGNAENHVLILHVLGGYGLAVAQVDQSTNEYKRVGIVEFAWNFLLKDGHASPNENNWEKRIVTLI